ncbi:recombination protein NinG [Deltaproteobacteria bacterium]|nr:recombination protein NinG [Deltaproteobacteria bacterium]
MKKIKPKKCKVCQTEFNPRSSLQKVCSPICAITLTRETQNKKQTKIAESKKKAERLSNRILKESLKPAGEYVKEAQAAINKYVRLRDRGQGCISCGGFPSHSRGGSFDAGHYRSRGAASHLRYNLYNIHAQCKKCNRYGSGNAVDYRLALIKKIGLEKVERLETDNAPRKFTIGYLKRIKKIFNRRARILERGFLTR